MKRIKPWNKIKLGDIAYTVNENELNPLQNRIGKYVAGGHMESENIHINKFGDIRKDKEILGSAFHRKFSTGDILFGTRNPHLKKAGVVTFDGICANTTLVLRSKHENFVNGLLPFILQWEKFTEFAVAKSVGSTNPYVRWRDLTNFEFFLPEFDEQIKIRDLFWMIQKSIDSSEILICKLKTYKDSKMEQLLSGKGLGYTKFKKVKWLFGKEIEIPEEWTVCKLSNVCKIRKINTVNSNLYVGLEHIEQNNNKLIERGNIDEFSSNKNVFCEQDVLYGKLRPNLNKVWLATNDGFCSIDILPLQVIKETIHPMILLSILTNHRFLCYAKSTSAGTKMPRTNWHDMKKFLVFLPPLLVQTRIASILSEIDEQIITAENHLLTLKELRKSIINEKLTPPKPVK